MSTEQDSIDYTNVFKLRTLKQVREIENPKIRALLQGRYRIVFYLKTDQEVEVLRVIHGSKLLDLE